MCVRACVLYASGMGGYLDEPGDWRLGRCVSVVERIGANLRIIPCMAWEQLAQQYS